MRMSVARFPLSETLPADLAAVKEYLRFDSDDDDGSITNMTRTAAAELEQFAQIALLSQTIRLTILDPSPAVVLRLPVGPVADDATITVAVDSAAVTDFDLIGGLRPMIRWRAAILEDCPARLDVEYTAGFGAAATDIPADLAQALMDQVALHFDGRSPMDARSLTTSPHLARIGARYRGVSA